MHDPIDRPVIILKWGNRLLWLVLFISLMVVMGYWHIPLTFAFLGAVGALLYVGFIWSNKEEEEIILGNPALGTGFLMVKPKEEEREVSESNAREAI